MKKTAAIIGVGLIGGSIGKAFRKKRLFSRVIGIGRNSRKLSLAKRQGAVTEWSLDYSVLSAADLVVICTPVVHIEKTFKEIGPFLKEGCIVTDAGSTKERIVKSSSLLPRRALFVGSHPVAGSHKSGALYSDGKLFSGSVCVVTPDSSTDKNALSAVCALWKRIGCRVIKMTPAEHDKVLAETSHVPHFVASALCLAVLDGNPKKLSLIGKGFKDTTRIAAGNPEVWCEIAQANKKNVVKGIDKVIGILQKIKKNAGNEKLCALLKRASDKRERL